MTYRAERDCFEVDKSNVWNAMKVRMDEEVALHVRVRIYTFRFLE